VALNENQFGALISWTYNVGCGNMQSSTLVRRLVAGDDPNTVAQEELPQWRLSRGQISQVLVLRRQAEIGLFQTPSSVMVLPPAC
jgi:lysozyme